MNELLDITNQDIASLEDGELRNLIGLLCEADYRSVGLTTKGIQWGGHQDAADGGVDVRVKSDVKPPDNSYVTSSHTIFQCKKTDMTPSLIQKEMQSSGVLKEVIADLATDDGAYIIASSQSITDKVYAKRLAEMEKMIGGRGVKVAYYHGGHLATWVRNKTKRSIYGWRSYAEWIQNMAKDEDYIQDTQCRIIDKRQVKRAEFTVEKGINEIRTFLSACGTYVRLTGLSGVGKTRFAQALFDTRIGVEALNPLLLFYTDISDDPSPSPQNMAEQIIAKGCRAILIVDNCSPKLHRSLVGICSQASQFISLLTIEYDVADDLPEETTVFHMEPASEDVVSKLILRRFPNVSIIDSRKIAHLSGGNARVAIALASTIVQGESIGELSDNELFKRLFNQSN